MKVMIRCSNYILVVMIVILCSCNKTSSKHEELRKLVEQNVVIPDSMYAYQFDADTIDFFYYENTNTRNKIVVYIDGGCFSCVEELNKWVAIEDEIILGDNIELLFIIKTDWDYFQIIKDYMVKSAFFNTKTGKQSTIILDPAGEFVKFNLIPDNRVLQAMLLDNTKKIVVYGNPVYSDELKQLYIDSIQVR